MKNNFENRFYSTGWEIATDYLYGNQKQKSNAEVVYDNFNRQSDFEEDGSLNENKRQFISGYTDKLMD